MKTGAKPNANPFERSLMLTSWSWRIPTVCLMLLIFFVTLRLLNLSASDFCFRLFDLNTFYFVSCLSSRAEPHLYLFMGEIIDKKPLLFALVVPAGFSLPEGILWLSSKLIFLGVIAFLTPLLVSLPERYWAASGRFCS